MVDKEAFLKEANETLAHPLVSRVLDEYRLNMYIEEGSLADYGLTKVAYYVALVSRAQALGIDPNELRATQEEQAEQMMKLIEAFQDAGKPVIVVETP